MGCPYKVKIIFLVCLAIPKRFKPLFFVSPQAHPAVISSYAQQVVTRVVGYSWCKASGKQAATAIISVFRLLFNLIAGRARR
mgnify:CR=1 FL=1